MQSPDRKVEAGRRNGCVARKKGGGERKGARMSQAGVPGRHELVAVAGFEGCRV